MGWGEAIAAAFKWFTPEAKHERVEDSLISTLDGLVKWIKKDKEVHGEYSPRADIDKYIDHYIRQYDGNRNKLR